MDLAKDQPFEEVAQKGAALYEQIKQQYEPNENGKFLAIEVESEDVYLADSTAEALIQARQQHPGKMFYVVKIGFNAIETLSNSILHRS